MAMLALAAAQFHCAAQESTPRFTITIGTKQSTAQSGSEIRVNVSLRNISDHPIWIYRDTGLSAEMEGYSVEVRDVEGRLQRTSRYYWSIGRFSGGKVPPGSEQDYSDNQYDGPGFRSGGRVNPDPAETRESWFDVNKLYIPLLPGKYTVQVQRIDDETKTVVKSNILTLTVTK
jgi:hypothetical protein